MEQYIKKSALVAVINKLKEKIESQDFAAYTESYIIGVKHTLETISDILNTLEVKEVKETEQRMKECPFRQDVCNRYKGTQVKCDGRCSWVVDYPKLKELKSQKGE